MGKIYDRLVRKNTTIDPTTLAWHYTIAPHAVSIADEGVIRLATAGLEETRKLTGSKEKPVTWFSTQPIWEKSASKVNHGCFSLSDHIVVFGSVWRLGVPISKLLPWHDLCVAAGINSLSQKILLMGGEYDPSFWYGTLEPVAVDQCVVHCWSRGESGWRGGSLKDAEQYAHDHIDWLKSNPKEKEAQLSLVKKNLRRLADEG